MNVLFQQHCQGMLWCCSGTRWGPFWHAETWKQKNRRPLPPVVSVAMLLRVRHVPLPSPLHKGTSLCLVGIDHTFHTEIHQWCVKHRAPNLDFWKGHVALSLSSGRVFDAGHPLGICGSLCCRVQGSWVQILKLISFLTLLLRILLFCKVLEITS